MQGHQIRRRLPLEKQAAALTEAGMGASGATRGGTRVGLGAGGAGGHAGKELHCHRETGKNT